VAVGVLAGPAFAAGIGWFTVGTEIVNTRERKSGVGPGLRVDERVHNPTGRE
jgi:hypothetical protein